MSDPAQLDRSLLAYERAVAPARAAFAALPALREVFDPAVSPRLLEAFLVHFCAFGVGMTEPVDGWIRRAGERCIALGHDALGEALQQHAAHEAGHHELMIADTRALVLRWNANGRSELDAEALLAQAPPPGVVAYRELHERTIRGETPYGQLAIELEIERLSVSHGAPLLQHCGARCGPELLACLSFVHDHVQLDVGHTALNERMLADHLAAHPRHLDAMVACGGEALSTYGAFLTNCLASARALVKQG